MTSAISNASKSNNLTDLDIITKVKLYVHCQIGQIAVLDFGENIQENCNKCRGEAIERDYLFVIRVLVDTRSERVENTHKKNEK